ncbi:hypothetical protein ACSQ6I_09710 [Anabaena sp. WFMT]
MEQAIRVFHKNLFPNPLPDLKTGAIVVNRGTQRVDVRVVKGDGL